MEGNAIKLSTLLSAFGIMLIAGAIEGTPLYATTQIPPNDDYANRINIPATPATVIGSSVNETPDGPPPNSPTNNFNV